MNSEITQSLYEKFLKNPSVTTDSRNVSGNALFFALKGETFNGNDYAENALNNGASFAIVDHPDYCKNERYIFVPDSLIAMQDLAKFHREKIHAKVIGITGTNGKTTTKELINAVLASSFNSIATTGNLNNHIGVPLTLLKINQGMDYAVVEMGANHPGEIAQLCSISKPDFGLITNISKAHLEGFGSFENIIHTKMELYDAIRKEKGTIFINQDNTILTSFSKGIDSFTYGFEKESQCMGTVLKCDPFLSIRYSCLDISDEINTHLIGIYNAENVLASIAVGIYFGVPPERIKQAIENYIPSNNRSQYIKTSKNTIILDAYNANPASLAVAIENFAAIPGNNKVLIAGDMAELGDAEKVEHLEIIHQIQKHLFEKVFLTGKVFHEINDSNDFMSFVNTQKLADYLQNHPVSGSTILIKGSRINRLESLIQYL